MRTVKSLSLGCLLSLFLAITVPAGEIPGPAKSQLGPGSGSKKLETTTCEPTADSSDQLSSGTICEEATPNPLTEATIIAIQLLISIY